jgi:hypothetical protein
MTKHILGIALLVALTTIGCKSAGPDGETAGGDTTGNGTFEGDGGAAEDDGPGPTITFVTPVAATDPNEDEVLTTPKVTVRCKVVRGQGLRATDVDPSTVKIIARDPVAKEPIEVPVKAIEDSQYEARFHLDKLPNGPVEFDCVASDVDGNIKTKTLKTLLDLGPSIEIVEPKDKSVQPLKAATSIQFRVKQSKLNADDNEASVATIDLTVAGVAIGFTEVSPQLYQATVSFMDEALFGTAPESAEIVVTASNRRTPEAAVREAISNIRIDAKGPTIKITSPTHTEVVRGTVDITFEATDPAGVDASSVIAEINKDTIVLTKWDVSGNTYTQSFDTRSFPDNLSQVTINVVVYDMIGNSTRAPVVIYLDNIAPLVSMDTPYIREQNQTDDTCSVAFDPLEDGVKDLAEVTDGFRPMALINDRANGAVDQRYLYGAGTDQESVFMWLQSDPTIPLLIDTDNDGKCDEINSEGLGEKMVPTAVQLNPAAQKGNAWYTSKVDFSETAHTTSRCATPKGEPEPPKLLCPVSRMSRLVRGQSDSKPPAVYGMKPSGKDTGECTGRVYVLAPDISGWICVATRVVDELGNVGVSRPLRICVGGCSDDPPTCREGCSQPDDYGKNLLFWK